MNLESKVDGNEATLPMTPLPLPPRCRSSLAWVREIGFQPQTILGKFEETLFLIFCTSIIMLTHLTSTMIIII